MANQSFGDPKHNELTAFSVWCVVTVGLTAWAPSSPGRTRRCVAVVPSSSSFLFSSSSLSSSSTRGSCVRSHRRRERSCPPLSTHAPLGHTDRHLRREKSHPIMRESHRPHSSIHGGFIRFVGEDVFEQRGRGKVNELQVSRASADQCVTVAWHHDERCHRSTRYC
ncbi:hypothetical protein E2C01_027220 [Portunus trituberculatus]|uniref:Uncharacterized protein n=1 Tax=Portunus trituberculatus TaxID=210409 RepID=A0A5B7EN59_PORTR|nr:hypothetical protein [Portunus trituberculatus]